MPVSREWVEAQGFAIAEEVPADHDDLRIVQDVLEEGDFREVDEYYTYMPEPWPWALLS
jgi:hypothetical protein